MSGPFVQRGGAATAAIRPGRGVAAACARTIARKVAKTRAAGRADGGDARAFQSTDPLTCRGLLRTAEAGTSAQGPCAEIAGGTQPPSSPACARAATIAHRRRVPPHVSGRFDDRHSTVMRGVPGPANRRTLREALWTMGYQAEKRAGVRDAGFRSTPGSDPGGDRRHQLRHAPANLRRGLHRRHARGVARGATGRQLNQLRPDGARHRRQQRKFLRHHDLNHGRGRTRTYDLTDVNRAL
jgi:hypothetical protein